MVGCVYMFVEFNSVTCEEVCLAFERIISVKSSLYIYIHLCRGTANFTPIESSAINIRRDIVRRVVNFDWSPNIGLKRAASPKCYWSTKRLPWGYVGWGW